MNALRAVVFRRALPSALFLLWLALLVPGVRFLRAFESTPGRMAAAPREWPPAVLPVGDKQLPTLVVALHTQCSCSKATLTELETTIEEFKNPYNAVLLIYRPRGDNYQWNQAGPYREAREALHASVVMDDDGEIARKFGALTSGEVLYYSAPDRNGGRHLLFSGGVTGGRGMIGANDGVEALKVAANKDGPHAGKNPVLSAKVYGCGLAAFSAADGKQTTP